MFLPQGIREGIDMKILIWDVGSLHVSTAQALKDEGHEVFYFCPWYAAYPKFKDYSPGMGVVEKVIDPAGYYDEVDLIVFPDIGAGKTADWLRKKGYPVFGAGLGEEFENDRKRATEIMDQYEIPYPKTTVVHGVTEALDFLFKRKQETSQLQDGKYFVKISQWRGSIDTFPVDTFEQAQAMFDKMRTQFGPYSEDLEILINEKSEGIETGMDLFFDGNAFIEPCLFGFECNADYIGYVVPGIPDFQKDYLTKVANYLRSVGYRGAFSTEVIYDGNQCFLIDATTRFPLPLGLMYSSFIPDFGEFLLSIAMGETPKTNLPEGKYLGIASFTSENAIDDWLPVTGMNEFTKLMRYIEINGETFIVPGISTLGCVVGSGDSFQSFQDNLTQNCQGVQAFFANLNPEFLPEVISKYLDPLKKYGVEFGPNTQLEHSITSTVNYNSRAGRFIQFLREQRGI